MFPSWAVISFAIVIPLDRDSFVTVISPFLADTPPSEKSPVLFVIVILPSEVLDIEEEVL